MTSQSSRWKLVLNLAALSTVVLFAACASSAGRSLPADLSGAWDNGNGLDLTSLVLRRTALDRYAVDWKAEGCLGSYTGSTTAVFVAGRLELASPVILYSDDRVARYTVSGTRRPTLIPVSPTIDSGYARAQTLRPARE